MKAPVAALKAARESRPGGRINLQESQSTTAATRQTRLLHASKNLQQVRGLGVLQGRRFRLGGQFPISYRVLRDLVRLMKRRRQVPASLTLRTGDRQVPRPC